MFNHCYKLKQIIEINEFDANNITNMKEMLQLCNQLEYLDLSNFNILEVIYM